MPYQVLFCPNGNGATSAGRCPGWMLSLTPVALLDGQKGIAELAAPHCAAAGARGASLCTSFPG